MGHHLSASSIALRMDWCRRAFDRREHGISWHQSKASFWRKEYASQNLFWQRPDRFVRSQEQGLGPEPRPVGDRRGHPQARLRQDGREADHRRAGRRTLSSDLLRGRQGGDASGLRARHQLLRQRPFLLVRTFRGGVRRGSARLPQGGLRDHQECHPDPGRCCQGTGDLPEAAQDGLRGPVADPLREPDGGCGADLRSRRRHRGLRGGQAERQNPVHRLHRAYRPPTSTWR